MKLASKSQGVCGAARLPPKGRACERCTAYPGDRMCFRCDRYVCTERCWAGDDGVGRPMLQLTSRNAIWPAHDSLLPLIGTGQWRIASARGPGPLLVWP